MSLDIDIRKSFGTFDLDVTFRAQDEIFGLLGASGCGKSLTMRCIAGIETPDEGHIIVNGTTFFDSSRKVNLKPQQRKTALLFQDYMLFPNLTVEDNVAAGIGKEVSRLERARIVDEELARFDVAACRGRYPAQLSGGQRQRVALARMLAARPGILMLDEPFSALDSHLKGMLEQNLASLFDTFHGTILYVSHDIDEAIRFCDRIAVVDAGHIEEVDAGRDLVNHPKSLAAIKLSGCKNVTEARYVDAHHVFCPRWGVALKVLQPVSEDVRHLGIRAFYLQHADGPSENTFLTHVDRASDSRFDRTLLLSFVHREPDSVEGDGKGEIHYLHQRLFWRISLLQDLDFPLPDQGDDVYVHLDPKRFYLVESQQLPIIRPATLRCQRCDGAI